MSVNQIPFNIDLLILDNNKVKTLRPVTSLSIFTASTKDFHPDGLYSTEIFGKIGDEARNKTYSYIDMRVPLFHPLLFKYIKDLSSLYNSILNGTKYAVFNEDIKDFIETTPDKGDTGFTFFTKYFKDLDIKKTNSIKREFMIKAVNKYKDKPYMSNIIVMPAGLRDYTIDKSGKPTEDEVNTIYRKLLSMSNSISNINLSNNLSSIDNIRYNMQVVFLELYDYIKNLLEGKRKLIQAKWASRQVFNSTRNVIVSNTFKAESLNDKSKITSNHTVIGLYQFLRAALPLNVKHIKDTYLSDIFIGEESAAFLINKKTLKREQVAISPEIYDSWMTYEGVEKKVVMFNNKAVRSMPVEVEDKYLALIYKGPDKTFKVFYDIDDLPEHLDKKYVTPITLAELFYLSVQNYSNTIPLFVTRYPVTGYGSMYPSLTYLKTTIDSEKRNMLNDNWEITDSIVLEMPIKDSDYFDGTIVANSHLGRLGADYDGDMVSVTAVLSEEAKVEIKKKLQSRDYYVDVNNEMFFNSSYDVSDLVIASITS